VKEVALQIPERGLERQRKRAGALRHEHEWKEVHLSSTRRGRVKVGPDKSTMQNIMAWRPYSNVIDGELDNRAPGKVTGWIRFFRSGRRPLKAVFDLTGDFHEDIRGKVIRLRNHEPSDEYHDRGRRTYMEGFSRVQRGVAVDITAGISLGPWTDAIAEKLMAQNELVWDEAGISEAERERQRQECAARHREHITAGDSFYPYVPYPYVEWYSDNGRVVLELDPSQVEIVESAPVKEKSAREFVADEARRSRAMGAFLGAVVSGFSEKDRKPGGNGNGAGAQVE